MAGKQDSGTRSAGCLHVPHCPSPRQACLLQVQPTLLVDVLTSNHVNCAGEPNDETAAEKIKGELAADLGGISLGLKGGGRVSLWGGGVAQGVLLGLWMCS